MGLFINPKVTNKEVTVLSSMQSVEDFIDEFCQLYGSAKEYYDKLNKRYSKPFISDNCSETSNTHKLDHYNDINSMTDLTFQDLYDPNN